MRRMHRLFSGPNPGCDRTRPSGSPTATSAMEPSTSRLTPNQKRPMAGSDSLCRWLTFVPVDLLRLRHGHDRIGSIGRNGPHADGSNAPGQARTGTTMATAKSRTECGRSTFGDWIPPVNFFTRSDT